MAFRASGSTPPGPGGPGGSSSREQQARERTVPGTASARDSGIEEGGIEEGGDEGRGGSDRPGRLSRTAAPGYAVAASGTWFDEEDDRRLPAGDTHARERGTDQTRCGPSLRRSRLLGFPQIARA
ncbi:hypothetical protein GCM10009759_56970 [Kitasatospora saccharophila]|uniref:Uncharacterized protein n=1 Tax=Kitasatospora saccharophila TaxID=407973 RepID=A0ABP5J900_9ACTN